MLDIDFTFVWTAINLIILYLFLKKFLFDRVGKYMDERSASIESGMEQAETMKAEGEVYRADQLKIRDDTAAECKAIITDAHNKAIREAESIVSNARKESAGLLAAAHEQIDRERERSMRELQDDVASLALAAASKVIAANMDNDKNRKIVEEFLGKEGVA